MTDNSDQRTEGLLLTSMILVRNDEGDFYTTPPHPTPMLCGGADLKPYLTVPRNTTHVRVRIWADGARQTQDRARTAHWVPIKVLPGLDNHVMTLKDKAEHALFYWAGVRMSKLPRNERLWFELEIL
jgi:hypothetical protein